MQITTLIENSQHQGRSDLKPEYGLSFYVDMGEQIILSDVGKTGQFAQNAARLGIDLGKVDALAITHHHFDHGGGLAHFFEENQYGQVYLRRSAASDFLVEGDESLPRHVGLDRKLMADHADRITWLDEDREILPGLHLLVGIPAVHPQPAADTRLKMQVGDEVLPDSFDHELVTVLEEQDGLVVLTGCAHNGVLNLVEAARRALPHKPIKAVIGGFHLAREDAGTVRHVGETLLEMEIPAIYTGHCTGEESTRILKEILGRRLHSLFSGMVIEI